MQALNESSLIEEVLKYIVACYGAEIYQDKQRLSNLIADLYTGEERLKRLYRRMVMEDAVSQQLYAISLKPIQEREGFYNRLVHQFKEANFLEEAFARQVLDAFLNGMNLLLVEPISTIATEEDGEWVDEYGVKYSADRKKLIDAPESLYGNYRVLNGTVIICDGAFRWRDNLHEITLPPSVTSIGDEAFCKCKNLQEIIIPPNVTSIGNNTFSHCINLQEIILPSEVTSIGVRAFWLCENLREINVTESNKFYRSIDGVLYTKDLKTIICYPQGKKDEKFVIPSGVTSIGDGAFSCCSNLQEITLSSGVMSIGECAFGCCFYLREVTLPPSVTSIGVAAFNSCASLQEITLPSGVTSIGDGAFSCCSNLREITLPPSVTSIEANVFVLCENLKRINIPRGTLEKFKKLLPEWTDELHEV